MKGVSIRHIKHVVNVQQWPCARADSFAFLWECGKMRQHLPVSTDSFTFTLDLPTSTTSPVIAVCPTWIATPWPEPEPSNPHSTLTTWRTTASMIPLSCASSRNWTAVSSRRLTPCSRTLPPSMTVASCASPPPTGATRSISLTPARTFAVWATTPSPLWPTFRYTLRHWISSFYNFILWHH